MTNYEEIEQTIRRIYKEKLDLSCDIDTIDVNEPLGQYGLDSISAIKVVVEIEETFDFEYLDEDLVVENFTSLDTVIKYVQKRIDEDE